MITIAEQGSRTAPESGANGALDAGSGIEFMFPFGRLFRPHPTKEDFPPGGFKGSLGV
jgi:hypothetical protein